MGSDVCFGSRWKWPERPLLAAGSTDRRNTCCELVCWGLIYGGMVRSCLKSWPSPSALNAFQALMPQLIYKNERLAIRESRPTPARAPVAISAIGTKSFLGIVGHRWAAARSPSTVRRVQTAESIAAISLFMPAGGLARGRLSGAIDRILANRSGCGPGGWDECAEATVVRRLHIKGKGSPGCSAIATFRRARREPSSGPIAANRVSISIGLQKSFAQASIR